MNATVNIGRRLLHLTNLDKVLYPQAGFSKAQVLNYYRRVAPVLLPHLRRRPLTLKRYPGGVDQQFFYEKRCPAHRPKWLPTAAVWSKHNGADIRFCLIEEPAALMWVANLASIELHTYLFQAPRVDRPTMIALDLDPGEGCTIVDCARLGLKLHRRLAAMGLEALAKTSGGKGFHMYVPLNSAGATFEQTKTFARDLAQRLEREDPHRVTSNMRRDLRRGRIFVDWSQNDAHKTTVCVYSLRARARPTVSTPLTWAEVQAAVRRGRPEALTFEAWQVAERIEKRGDLFSQVLTVRQKLP